MESEELYTPKTIRNWAETRARYRAEKNWEQADLLRDRIAATGYTVKDGAGGFEFGRPTISAPEDVPSRLEKESASEWSVAILARDRLEDLSRAAESAVHHGAAHELEVIVIGNGDDATHNLMADLATAHAPVRPFYTSQDLGEGAALCAALRAARGKFILVMGAHIELTGDPFDNLASTLADEKVGVTGGWGAVTTDLMNYEATDGPEVDAVEFYLFAFRRALLSEVGLPDQRYRFYRNLDLDWSLAFKDKGYRLMLAPDLPTKTHEHIWRRTDAEERERLSKKNYRYLPGDDVAS
jgi:cysteinyl-tRNA synthetase